MHEDSRPVKRVVDYNVKIRVKPDGTGVELANVKMSMNPFDEIAVEEALAAEGSRQGEEVVVVSIGPAKAEETLAHRARHGRRPRRSWSRPTMRSSRSPSPRSSRASSKRTARPVIVGKQAIDDDSNQTGQMLAALLGWAQGTFASKIEIGDGKATGDPRSRWRPADGRDQAAGVVTTDLRLNEPRYASLPNIMKAKKKPLDKKSPADFGVDTAPRLKVLKTEEPSGRKAGVKVKSVAELVDKLKNEAGVL
jgi:electron transfer flavoprotein beta subunit